MKYLCCISFRKNGCLAALNNIFPMGDSGILLYWRYAAFIPSELLFMFYPYFYLFYLIYYLFYLKFVEVIRPRSYFGQPAGVKIIIEALS